MKQHRRAVTLQQYGGALLVSSLRPPFSTQPPEWPDFDFLSGGSCFHTASRPDYRTTLVLFQVDTERVCSRTSFNLQLPEPPFSTQPPEWSDLDLMGGKFSRCNTLLPNPHEVTTSSVGKPEERVFILSPHPRLPYSLFLI